MSKNKGKKILTTGLGVVLMAAQALSVSADTDDDIATVQSQQAQTNAQLSEVQNSINDMEAQKQTLLDQIDGYDQELVVTMASIKSLDNQVDQAEKDLEQTGKDLEQAKEDQKTQYDAMKKRIQYLYEEGGTGGWANIMLGETSLSEGMNQVDDTQSLYKFDRSELENYTETVQKVTDLQTQQTQQKASLETMKQEQEAAKDNLEELKADAQAESDDYEAKISDAEATANQYYDLISQQNDQIAELQAQKAEEEAAAQKAAEEEAARQAAAQQAAQQTASQAAEDSSSSGASASGTSSSGTSYTGEQAAQQQATQESISNGSTATVDTSSQAGSNASGSATGSAIAAYATQFVGNPYVWGGTSLTNGADCSGFVQSVFAHFGISLSRTTYTQANEGVAVSYDQMQPGDVINYGFHTAIYIGNNQIVHAADSNLGIIIQSNPAFQPIVTIRRFY